MKDLMSQIIWAAKFRPNTFFLTGIGDQKEEKTGQKVSSLLVPPKTFLCFLPSICLLTIKSIPMDSLALIIRKLLLQSNLKTRHCKIYIGSYPTRCSWTPSEETGMWVWDRSSESMMVRLLFPYILFIFFST